MRRRAVLALIPTAIATAAIAVMLQAGASTPSALASHAAGGAPTFTATPTSQHPPGACGESTSTPTTTPGGPTATSTPTTTPCFTPTTTPKFFPCATPSYVPTVTPGPTATHTPTGVPCPPAEATPTATPCPTDQAPIVGGSGCGTITPTPTSQRPYGAGLVLVDNYPNPAVSGRTHTWTFAMENTGSPYGCEAHQVDFYATMGGQAGSPFYSSSVIGCHEVIEVDVSSLVTAAPGDTISIDARASAGASPIEGHVTESDTVVAVGNMNCDGDVNAIDAALILQLDAALIQPTDCVEAGDANNDGLTNAVDATLILQYVAGLITTF